MRRALVHIGLHKTGSSYIQGILSRQAAALSDHGVHYPRAGLQADTRQLTRTLRKEQENDAPQPGRRSDPKALWTPTVLERTLANHREVPHLFISEEAYEVLGRYPASLRDFHSRLEAEYSAIKYRAVIRHCVAHASSSLQQQVKGFQRIHYRSVNERLFNYSLDNRLGAFATEQIPLELLSFDEVIKGDTPKLLQRWIKDDLGVDFNELHDIPPANTTINAEGVAFMVTLGQLIRAALGRRPPRREDWPHLAELRQAVLEVVRSEIKGGTKFCPFPENVQLEAIEKIVSQSQRIVSHAPGSWQKSAFSERTTPYGVVLISEMDRDARKKMTDLVLSTWEKMAPLLELDFQISSDFEVKRALKRFLKNERKRLLEGPQGQQ